MARYAVIDHFDAENWKIEKFSYWHTLRVCVDFSDDTIKYWLWISSASLWTANFAVNKYNVDNYTDISTLII